MEEIKMLLLENSEFEIHQVNILAVSAIQLSLAKKKIQILYKMPFYKLTASSAEK